MATSDHDAPPLRRPPSLVQTAKSYLDTWVDLLRTRLELFTTELEEERARQELILILAVGSAFCLTFAVLLLTLFVVVAFWETNHRLIVLAGLALFYLAIGLALGGLARRKTRNRPRLFSATLGELAKDRAHLASQL